jgi:hypothetical protein
VHGKTRLIPSYAGAELDAVRQLSWNVLPPAVLFLANSREESAGIAKEMRGFLLAKALRVAYLLDPTVAVPVDILGFYMDRFRTKDKLQWEKAVHALMRAVPIIAIDVRVHPVRRRNGGWPFKMTTAKLRLAQAAMGQPATRIGELCIELGVSRQTLYRHMNPTGQLRPDGEKLLGRKRRAGSNGTERSIQKGDRVERSGR